MFSMAELTFVEDVSVRLMESSASDDAVAQAAWVSNDKFGEVNPEHVKPWAFGDAVAYNKRVEGLINFLYRERHMSPFEHGMLKFWVDCPIFVAREFMRHRTFSYNETSGRYRDLDPRFFLVGSERPLVQTGKVGAYRFTPGTDEQYGTVFAETAVANGRAWMSYQNMLKVGVTREVARNVLPVNTMTQFYVTGNPRNWMQFLTLRNDANALKEIRDVAVKIEASFKQRMPLTHAAYKKYDWRQERNELATLRRKVAQFEAEETYKDNLR